MADNRGKKIGTFEIEDELEIDEVNDFMESLNGGDFVLVNKWSEGKIEVYKPMNKELDDIE